MEICFSTIARYSKWPYDPVDIKITPSRTSTNIIINYPGFKGDIDGYNQKHQKLAELMARKKLGGVVRMANVLRENRDYKLSAINDLKAVVEFTLYHAHFICGVTRPELYLIGTSAGGGAVAAVAGKYPQVKKILLMAPSTNVSQTVVKKAFRQFEGEIYIVVGDKDEVTGIEAAQYYYDLAEKASRRELVIIPDCDHQFRGTKNSQIMGKAPFWAFGSDTTFPSPEGGPILY